MTCRAGFAGEAKQHFNRYIEDCGISCDLVTPQMLAAPFFRPTFNCLIIPTGFANPAYSNLLPALRASSSRIQRFVEEGGNLLVFGAAADKPDAYDWLPFSLTYHHDFHPRSVNCPPDLMVSRILDDFDASCVECDGSFLTGDADAAITGDGATILVEKQIGQGRIVVTSIHEFPSREFIRLFCSSGRAVHF